jgi:hypothetical protein
MNRLDIACFGAVALSAAALLIEHQSKARLLERNRVFRREVAQWTQPPPAHAPLASTAAPASELLRLRGDLGRVRQEEIEAGRLQADDARLYSNWVQQLKAGKRLSLDQVESYLAAKQRGAESLLAAFQLTGERSLLREAVEHYPSDPRVAFAACVALKDEATPEEQRARLEAFKQAAPDNPLANYLEAQADFKSGQITEAIAELTAASGKSAFRDYYSENMAADKEAYQAAGLSPLDAALLAEGEASPPLAGLVNVGRSLLELAQRYQQAGDESSAQAAVQMGVALGCQVAELTPQNSLIDELVGWAIEQRILKALDPASPYGTSGYSVGDRLDELGQQKAQLKQALGMVGTLSKPDLEYYLEQVSTAGESKALQWVLSRPPP